MVWFYEGPYGFSPKCDWGLANGPAVRGYSIIPAHMPHSPAIVLLATRTVCFLGSTSEPKVYESLHGDGKTSSSISDYRIPTPLHRPHGAFFSPPHVGQGLSGKLIFCWTIPFLVSTFTLGVLLRVKAVEQAAETTPRPITRDVFMPCCVVGLGG